jgi:hypothetical protein
MTLTAPRPVSSTAPPVAPPAARPPAPERRRSTPTLRSSDYFAIVGALVAAVSTTALLFAAIAPLKGRLGFVVVTYLLFLALYTLLVSFDENGPAVRDRVAAVVVHSIAAVLFGALVAVVVYTVYRGASALPYLSFFTEDLSNTGPLDPVDVGGVAHALLGTLIMIGIALAVVIPLGITCALFLNELPGPLRPGRAHDHRGDDGAAVDRGRPVHLRDAHPGAGLREERLRRRHGHQRHDAADHHPGGRRRAAPGAAAAQGGLAGAGRRAVAHHLARHAADGAVRAGHGRHPRHRPRHRRDLAGAAHRRLHAAFNTNPFSGRWCRCRWPPSSWSSRRSPR